MPRLKQHPEKFVGPIQNESDKQMYEEDDDVIVEKDIPQVTLNDSDEEVQSSTAGDDEWELDDDGEESHLKEDADEEKDSPSDEEEEEDSSAKNEKDSSAKNEKDLSAKSEKDSSAKNEKDSSAKNEKDSSAKNEKDSSANNEKDSSEKNEKDSSAKNEVNDVNNLVPDTTIIVPVPSYESSFTGFLMEKEYSIETGKHVKNDILPQRTCFNCLGDHGISDCTAPKDYAAIARNRRNFMGKKVSSIRYHNDVENKYSLFRPGEISDGLRNALGLNDNESPEYIYRMRILGYPPGWLKEAEVQRSDMSLFDGSGKQVSHPEDEEGETDMALIKYKPEKLISYPGFNVAFPEEVFDQHRQLNFPRMQPQHSRDNFLQFMRLNKASKYKRKKLRDDATKNIEPEKLHGDMEVDDLQHENSSIEVCPPETEKLKREEGELSEDSNDTPNDSATQCSSSEQATLQDTQNSADSSISSSPNPSSLKRKTPAEDWSESSCDSPASATMTPRESRPLSTKRLHQSASKGFTLGVTIPESITRFQTLPDADKWTVDVSEHINFDNLPDALGTWQKMRGIVSNVQSVMQKLHTEEDN